MPVVKALEIGAKVVPAIIKFAHKRNKAKIKRVSPKVAKFKKSKEYRKNKKKWDGNPSLMWQVADQRY